MNTQRGTRGKFWTREDLDDLERRFEALKSSMSQVLGMAPGVQQQMCSLETEVAELRRVMHRALMNTEHVTLKIKELEVFDGSRCEDARELHWQTKVEDALAGQPVKESCAQGELRQQNVRNLHEALATVDQLLDFRLEGGLSQEGQSSSRPPSKGRSGERTKDESKTSKSKQGRSSSSSVNQPRRMDGKKGIKCFICIGPHYTRDCPQYTDLNTLHREGVSKDEEPMAIVGVARVGALQVIDCLREEKMIEGSLSTTMENGLDETDKVVVVHCESNLEIWHDETDSAKSDERLVWLKEIFRRHRMIVAKGGDGQQR
eukprot:Gb_12196 [translate_table: standard]